MSINSPSVQSSVAELVRIITRTPDVSPSEVQRLTRLLRPVTTDLSTHVPALKYRIREQILRNASETNANGPANVVEFDRLLDDLNHVHPNLVPSTLALLEPLSFQKYLVKSSGSGSSGGSYFTTNNSDSLKDRELINERAPKKFIPVAETRMLAEEARSILRSDMLWISPETEEALIRDLLYIFQVLIINY